MNTISLESSADVAEYVTAYLAGHWPEYVRDLAPVVHSVRREDEWWYVHLEPAFWPEPRFRFYEAIASAESAIAREIEGTGHFIVLVPHHHDD